MPLMGPITLITICFTPSTSLYTLFTSLLQGLTKAHKVPSFGGNTLFLDRITNIISGQSSTEEVSVLHLELGWGDEP